MDMFYLSELLFIQCPIVKFFIYVVDNRIVGQSVPVRTGVVCTDWNLA